VFDASIRRLIDPPLSRAGQLLAAGSAFACGLQMANAPYPGQQLRLRQVLNFILCCISRAILSKLEKSRGMG
jgi:hypothetical protein